MMWHFKAYSFKRFNESTLLTQKLIMLLCLMFQRFQYFDDFMFHCFNSSMFNASIPQWLYTSMSRCLNALVPQWLNASKACSVAQQLNASTSQRFSVSTAHRLTGSRLNGSKLPCLSANTSISQHLNSPTPSTVKLLNGLKLQNFNTSTLHYLQMNASLFSAPMLFL